TGKYLMALSPGFIYRITVKAEGFASVEEDFDIENLGAYIEKTKDFYLYPPSSNTETSVPTVTDTPVAITTETTSNTTSTETPTIAAVENKEPISDVKTEDPVLIELEAKKEQAKKAAALAKEEKEKKELEKKIAKELEKKLA